MVMRMRTMVLLVLTAVLMSGCMRYAASIYPEDVLDPSKGYFYGRFSSDMGMNFGATQMGVVVTSTDKKQEIALRFEPTLDPYAVAVDPGDYRVTHIVYTQGADNSKRGEKPFPEDLAGRVIHVEAGKAYYLGDFDGASNSKFFVLFIAHEWRLGRIANEFGGTTAKLEELFPNMKGMPKVDVFGGELVTAFSGTAAPKAEAASSTTSVIIPPVK